MALDLPLPIRALVIAILGAILMASFMTSAGAQRTSHASSAGAQYQAPITQTASAAQR